MKPIKYYSSAIKTPDLKKLIPKVFIICLSVICLYGVGLSHQEAFGEIFGITIDNTCKVYIKNNFSSPCPTFELIDQLYPTSVCNFDGAGCAQYFRQIQGHHYIVDPEAATMERIKMITIRYDFDQYHIQGVEGFDNTNRTVNYKTDYYIDKCSRAYIDADSWIKYTGYIIQLFHHNCDSKYSYFDNNIKTQLNTTKHSIADSYKYQLEQWIKESKEKCIRKCFEY